MDSTGSAQPCRKQWSAPCLPLRAHPHPPARHHLHPNVRRIHLPKMRVCLGASYRPPRKICRPTPLPCPAGGARTIECHELSHDSPTSQHCRHAQLRACRFHSLLELVFHCLPDGRHSETRAAALGLHEVERRVWRETALPPTPSSPSPTFSPPGSPKTTQRQAELCVLLLLAYMPLPPCVFLLPGVSVLVSPPRRHWHGTCTY